MNSITKEDWGHLPSGHSIDLYRLRNARGIEAAITTYGGRLVALKAPDRHGRMDDVVLGFDDLAGYLNPNPYFGALVGRYANRIAHGQFTLGGHSYKLARNNGENSLHGGLIGFDKVAWSAKPEDTSSGAALRLHYFSRDGEEGYPGNLDVAATYTLTDENELRIEFEADTDKDTVVNLTNHSYFDLAGQGSGKVLEHRAMINSDRFTPVNANLIPTGELRNVKGTPFDFLQPTVIGTRIDDNDEQLGYGKGYDHNFVLNGPAGQLSLAGRVVEPHSGRVLEVFTTQPGLQFYTGNHLRGSTEGKGGAVYGVRSGFCVETQHFPDSPNQPAFPSTELKPGERFRQTTIFKFSVDETSAQ